MTDNELRDSAIEHLKKTSVGYVNKHWTTPPVGTEWEKGLSLLMQIGEIVSPPPPPPSSGGVPLPVGPLTDSPPIYLPFTGGGTTEKKRVRSSATDGLRLMKWPPVQSAVIYNLLDLQVDHVAADPPRSADGTKESGFWIGQKAYARRLLATDCAWMGMWTGCWCDLSDIGDFTLIRMPHTGLYCEHVTSHTRFHDFKIEILSGAPAEAAVKCEWWYKSNNYGVRFPQFGGRAGSYSNIFENFDITVPPGAWAFYLDAGTFDCTIRNGIIRGGNGIRHPKNLMDPSKPNKIDWSSIQFISSGTREEIHNNAIGN